MRRRTLALLAGTLLLADDRPTLSLTAINDLIVQHNGLATLQGLGTDPRPGQHQEQLSLLGHAGAWSGGLILRDVNFYQQQPQSTLEASRTRLHRAFLKYTGEGLHLQAGDFYTLLGRGLVLSVVQNDKTLRERTLRGLDARYQAGAFEVRALGGEVRTETGEQVWNVRAGEATWEFLKGQRLGLRASRVEDVRSLLRLGGRTTRSASLAGRTLGDRMDYYTESAELRFDQTGRRQGKAAYSNLTFHQDGWLLQAEHKRYRDFDNEMNNPPVADRDDELNNLYDAEGYRLLVQRAWREPSVTVYANGGRYREGLFQGNQWYGGFTLDDLLEDHLSASFQYGAKQLLYRTRKTDGSLTWRFTPRWSLQGTFREKRYGAGSFRFLEKDASLTLARAAWGSAFATWQYTEEKVMNLNNLWSGGFRVELRKGSYLELSGGRLRGGEVCSGGQCAFLPPFKGWKLASHWQF